MSLLIQNGKHYPTDYSATCLHWLGTQPHSVDILQRKVTSVDCSPMWSITRQESPLHQYKVQ